MKLLDALTALGALAQETRLQVFRLLVEAGGTGMTVGTIADSLDVPSPTLSFHLKELSNARLIKSRQEGRFIWYSANFIQMQGLVDYLTENCCARDPKGSSNCC